MTIRRHPQDARHASRGRSPARSTTSPRMRLSRGRGLRCVALRLRLHGLGTAAAASTVSRFRRLFGGVGDLLEGGATLRRSPPGQHVALQARVELIDAPFGLGAIGSGVDLDFGDAVGQQLYLLFGVGERGLARLQRLRQDVRPFRQRRPPLLELADLAVKPIARRREPLDDLIRGVASDGPFHHLALQDPDVLGARGKRLAHLGEQFLGGGGARTQRLEPQIHRIGFGLMSLVGLVAGGRHRDALVLGGSQADLHLLQPRPRGGQSVLAFVRRRDKPVSCASWLSRLAISARTATISLVSSVLSPSSPRAACCASVNSRCSSSPTLSNSAARFSSALNSVRTLSWPARSSASALRKPTLSVFSCSSACSAEPMGSTRLRKASLRSSSAPIRRSVSISRLRSASFSSPTRAPMSANVGSLGSSTPGGPGLAGVGTANAADVDAPPLRARKWVIVRMASPQPDKTSLAYTDFCNPSQ